MAPETLTAFERQTLINQYNILAKLDPDQAEDYQNNVRILREGLTIKYDDVFDVWEEMSLDKCRYVYEVLDMFRFLRFSFDDLKDKQGLTEDDITFKGFDGNNESQNHGLVSFMKEQGMWTETLHKGVPLNSHSITTVSLYPRMLAKFTPIWEKKNHSMKDQWLTAEEIKKILFKAEE
jgi:uncharacterized protein YfbU (UPF0304 family)